MVVPRRYLFSTYLPKLLDDRINLDSECNREFQNLFKMIPQKYLDGVVKFLKKKSKAPSAGPKGTALSVMAPERSQAKHGHAGTSALPPDEEASVRNCNKRKQGKHKEAIWLHSKT